MSRQAASLFFEKAPVNRRLCRCEQESFCKSQKQTNTPPHGDPSLVPCPCRRNEKIDARAHGRPCPCTIVAPSNARQGKARQGKARQGKAEGKARQGKARQARQGKQGKARHPRVRQGNGKARPHPRRKLICWPHFPSAEISSRVPCLALPCKACLAAP